MCLSVYVVCPEPHSPPLDPYILDTCDLFVLLCHMLGMSSIRVKFSGLLYIYALPEGGGCGPMGNHNTIGFLSNTGSEPTKTRKATKSAFNVGPQSAGQRNAISMANPL